MVPMHNTKYTILSNRGVIEVSGDDRKHFLQGLISNDIKQVSPTHTIYAALLTAQGKYLFDFFVIEINTSIYIDCEQSRASALLKKLALYKLRAKIDLVDRSQDFQIAAVFGKNPHVPFKLQKRTGHAKRISESIVYIDPRLMQAGVRILSPKSNIEKLLNALPISKVNWEDFDAQRISLGLPDGTRDLVPEKSILLESGFEELNGIDWDKGCYMGQELTARTKYRGLVKKRLIPVTFKGKAPTPGTPITVGRKKVGEMRSTVGNTGMALIRVDDITSTPLSAAETIIKPQKPNWVNF
ncbi:MAG: hypothetical protein CMF70_04150 [Magnetovibrio sp.]|nr:hypothetical protein [Magnetovibrio sp.]